MLSFISGMCVNHLKQLKHLPIASNLNFIKAAEYATIGQTVSALKGSSGMVYLRRDHLMFLRTLSLETIAISDMI